MKALLRIHRVFGRVLGLLLLSWFLSGLVLCFFDYPRLEETERLTALPELRAESQEPAALWWWTRGVTYSEQSGGGGIYLTGVGDGVTGPVRRRLLLTGEEARRVDPERARDLAVEHFRRSPNTQNPPSSSSVVVAERVMRLVEADQWTVSGFFQPFFPLWRVALNDERHTEVYISERTGEVVQESTRFERAMSWIGAIPHWIYPVLLRRHAAEWRWTVLSLAALGLILSLSGGALGLMMAARSGVGKERGVSRRLSPYKTRYQRLHHLSGLVFGLCVSSWLFSGALSLNPFRLSPGSSPPAEVLERYQGDDPEPALDGVLAPWRVIEACGKRISVRELRYERQAGRFGVVCVESPLKTRWVQLKTGTQDTLEVLESRPVAELRAALSAALPGAEFSLEVSSEPDDYHYPSHRGAPFVTPYGVAVFEKETNTRAYVDLRSGAILSWQGSGTRLTRWLFSGLHCLDFAVLRRVPPLRRLLIGIAMGLGVVLSLSGLGLGVRRFLVGRHRRLGCRLRVSEGEKLKPARGPPFGRS